MAVSGTMAMDRALLWSGSGAIGTQRGDAIWGANWLYNRDGVQNDVLVIAEEFKNLSTSGAYATDADLYAASGNITTNGTLTGVTLSSSVAAGASGGFSIGTQAAPFSGIILTASDTAVPMRLYVLSNGLVSGVAL